jgi:phosphoribosylformylglycinamidine synthase
MYLPMAHAEGKFLADSETTLQQLARAGRLALRYTTPEGKTVDDPLPFPHNPNGADRNVAGICDASGRLFGLMPHPERHIDPTHHPFWTRRETQPEHGDGLPVFANAIAYFA